MYEEHGYPGDPSYPMFYYETEYTENGYEYVLKPTFCTNVEIQGHKE